MISFSFLLSLYPCMFTVIFWHHLKGEFYQLMTEILRSKMVLKEKKTSGITWKWILICVLVQSYCYWVIELDKFCCLWLLTVCVCGGVSFQQETQILKLLLPGLAALAKEWDIRSEASLIVLVMWPPQLRAGKLNANWESQWLWPPTKNLLYYTWRPRFESKHQLCMVPSTK